MDWMMMIPGVNISKFLRSTNALLPGAVRGGARKKKMQKKIPNPTRRTFCIPYFPAPLGGRKKKNTKKIPNPARRTFCIPYCPAPLGGRKKKIQKKYQIQHGELSVLLISRRR